MSQNRKKNMFPGGSCIEVWEQLGVPTWNYRLVLRINNTFPGDCCYSIDCHEKTSLPFFLCEFIERSQRRKNTNPNDGFSVAAFFIVTPHVFSTVLCWSLCSCLTSRERPSKQKIDFLLQGYPQLPWEVIVHIVCSWGGESQKYMNRGEAKGFWYLPSIQIFKSSRS